MTYTQAGGDNGVAGRLFPFQYSVRLQRCQRKPGQKAVTARSSSNLEEDVFDNTAVLDFEV